MNPKKPPPPQDANEEIATLIETLHQTGQRLEDLTAGEVDTVADRDGRTFVLRRAQEQLRLSEVTKQAAILNALPAQIALLDTQGRIISVNEAWRRFGSPNVLHGPGYGIGLNFLEICDSARGDDASEAHQVAEGIRSVLDGGAKSFSIEYACHSPTEQRWFVLTATPLADDHPNGAIVMHLNITERKAHQKELEYIAHYDALTSLPNRVLLADRLHQGMAQVQRRGQMLAVAFLDLDAFKAINDKHGHEAGDQLLIALAARMKLALRESDTLSRLGGDEFVVVLLDLADVAASVPMLTRLLTAAAQPVQFGDITIQVTASLGVTFYPQANDVDADQLLRQADQAMYQAKQTGKNRYHVFDAEQDRNVRGHHESLERIRRALSEREFVLYYQPKVNMRTGTVIGSEALIRWQHPEQGLLQPAVFLPVIEDHPLAIELGELVLDTALREMALWQSAGLDIPVSVNIGARQLQQADFVERLREILAAHPNVRPGDLELEVLETSALGDLARVSAVIEACREIGVMFALDDFGTGYSSLTYLKRLPVTQLKIDQSFVRDMLDDPDDLAILEGVVGLAAVFRRQVIAEGVETVEHGAMLLQLGCELAQGYGIARPMLAANLPSWSAAWRPDPAWVDLAAVSRDDLPLLFARAEHCAWILAIGALLKGEREARPPLDQHQCRFGTWLDAQGMARYGVQPAFLAIEPLHRQVHALAGELLELQARGRGPEALARLGELHGLRDAFLEQLKTLVQDNRQQAR